MGGWRAGLRTGVVVNATLPFRSTLSRSHTHTHTHTLTHSHRPLPPPLRVRAPPRFPVLRIARALCGSRACARARALDAAALSWRPGPRLEQPKPRACLLDGEKYVTTHSIIYPICIAWDPKQRSGGVRAFCRWALRARRRRRAPPPLSPPPPSRPGRPGGPPRWASEGALRTRGGGKGKGGGGRGGPRTKGDACGQGVEGHTALHAAGAHGCSGCPSRATRRSRR